MTRATAFRLLLLARSLDGNKLTNNGEDMSAVLKLAEVLPQTKLQTLRCLPLPNAAAPC